MRSGFRRIIVAVACGLALSAGLSGTTRAEGPALTLQVVVKNLLGKATIGFSGGIEASRDIDKDGTYDFVFASSDMQDVIVEANLTVTSDETTLVVVPLKFPKPYKAYTRKLFVFADSLKDVDDAVLNTLKRDLETAASKVYVLAKAINKSQVAEDDYYFRVRSAQLWFKANYSLATAPALVQADVVAIDPEAGTTLLEYIKQAYSAGADAGWRDAWRKIFPTDDETARIKNEISNAEFVEWNFLRYVRYYLESGNASDACSMLQHFYAQWVDFSDERKALLSATRSKKIAEMDQTFTDLKADVLASSPACIL